MRARELAVDFPPSLLTAAPQLLRLVIPHYVRDAPALARFYDEGHADRLCAHLAGKSVADLLGHERTPVLVVDAEATAMEIASVMARAHSPTVAVCDDARHHDAPLIGVVTVAQLFARLLPLAAPH